MQEDELNNVKKNQKNQKNLTKADKAKIFKEKKQAEEEKKKQMEEEKKTKQEDEKVDDQNSEEESQKRDDEDQESQDGHQSEESDDEKEGILTKEIKQTWTTYNNFVAKTKAFHEKELKKTKDAKEIEKIKNYISSFTAETYNNEEFLKTLEGEGFTSHGLFEENQKDLSLYKNLKKDDKNFIAHKKFYEDKFDIQEEQGAGVYRTNRGKYGDKHKEDLKLLINEPLIVRLICHIKFMRKNGFEISRIDKTVLKMFNKLQVYIPENYSKLYLFDWTKAYIRGCLKALSKPNEKGKEVNKYDVFFAHEEKKDLAVLSLFSQKDDSPSFTSMDQLKLAEGKIQGLKMHKKIIMLLSSYSAFFLGDKKNAKAMMKIFEKRSVYLTEKMGAAPKDVMILAKNKAFRSMIGTTNVKKFGRTLKILYDLERYDKPVLVFQTDEIMWKLEDRKYAPVAQDKDFDITKWNIELTSYQFAVKKYGGKLSDYNQDKKVRSGKLLDSIV